MTLVNFYLFAMIATMVTLTIVHIICRFIVREYPDIMPDREQRYWFNAAEVSMAMMCLSGLWFMWYVWDFMVHICTTDPLAGALMHMPWVIGGLCAAVCKSMHLKRLLGQVKALP